jgi:hypothetical protein
MEVAVVSEGEKVQFETFALHHPLPRDITDVNMSEIRLSCFGAECSELRAIERNEIFVLWVFVRESLQHGGIIVVAILHVLVSQESDPLQFVFCSHVSFQF